MAEDFIIHDIEDTSDSIVGNDESLELAINSLVSNSIGIGGVGQEGSSVNKKIEATIAKSIGNSAREKNFLYDNGCAMVFDGKRYVSLGGSTLDYVSGEVMKRLGVGIIYEVFSKPTVSKYILSSIMMKKYKPDRNLVSFENCVLNLNDMKPYKHSYRFHTKFFMNYEYNPKAKCPKFKSFMLDVLPNIDTINMIQEFCGALFIKRSMFKIENILYLLGGGSNGKGVFEQVLRACLGEGNYSAFSVQELCKSNDSKYNIAAADGKIANICSDMDNSDISGGKFKQFVSNDKMMCRHMYGEPFMSSELPLIIALVNRYPATTDHTMGHHRRPIVVEFRKEIAEDKKKLRLAEELIEQELPGIFNWILEGRKRLIEQKGKINISEESRETMNKLKIESNSVFKFLFDKGYYPKQDEKSTRICNIKLLSDIFNEYRDYCKEKGKSSPFDNDGLGRLMVSEKYEKAPRRSKGAAYYVYEDIATTMSEEEQKIYLEKLKEEKEREEQQKKASELPF